MLLTRMIRKHTNTPPDKSLLNGIRYSQDGIQTISTTSTDLSSEIITYGPTTFSSNPVVGNATADTTSLILKFNGDLTINQGVILTPSVRKRGMFIYVDGNLNLNGTISMTARGAKAAGQIVHVHNGIILPDVGGVGGAKKQGTVTLNKGNNGGTKALSCGGGGSGGVYGYPTNYNGSGATGTTWSGGGGSGGLVLSGATGTNAGINGGAGSAATGAGNIGTSTQPGGGGAGNNGGLGWGGNYPNPTPNPNLTGTNGTGGTIILFVTGNLFIGATGKLESKGSKGGPISVQCYAAGGGSGGGLILTFCASFTNNGTIDVSGGLGGVGPTNTPGGSGGAGYYSNYTI